MRTLLISIIFAFALKGNAQNQNKFSEIPPSPNAANLGKFGEIPVNQSTGTLNLSVPLVTIQERDINWPIALNYNFTGYKPLEHPGWVGRGWSLSGGGIITRTIRGLADETPSFGYLTIGQEYADILMNNPSGVSSSPIFQSLALGDGVYDTEPDIFYFNFGNISGKFFFGQDGNAHIVSNKKYKIEKTIGSSGTDVGDRSLSDIIESFTITDDDGIKYLFNVKEYSTSFLGGSSASWGVSTWHIKELVTPNGNKLQFNYTPGGQTTIISPSFVEKGIYPNCNMCNDFGASSLFVNDISFQHSEEKFLTSIEVLNGFTKVEFNSEVINDYVTTYLSTTRKLKSVVLTDKINSNFISKKRLTYNDTFPDILVQVQNEDGNGNLLEPYKFEYIDGIASTNIYLTRAIDHWGYYNAGIPGNTLIPEFGANRNPNINGSKRNALTKITYPTGGSSIITYEQNDYAHSASGGPVSGDLIDVENFYYVYHGIDQTFSEAFDPISVNYQSFYTVYINWEYYNGCCPGGNQCTGSFPIGSGYLFPGQTYANEYFINNDILEEFGSECNSDFHIFANVTLNNVIAKNSKYGPGIRIKSIEKFDPIRALSELTEYKYKETSDISKSSGAINTTPAYSGEILLPQISIGLPFYRNNSFINLGGPMVIYENVDEVVNNISRTNYTFSTYKLPYLDIYSFEGPLASNVEKIGSFESYDFARGVNLSTKYFKNNNILQKEISNQYSFRRVSGPGLQNNFEYKIPSMYYEGLTKTITWVGNGNAYFPVYWNKFYFNISSFFEKTKETTTTYNESNEIEMLTEVNYSYENVSHLQLTKQSSLNSKNEIVETITKYPEDYLVNPSRANFINTLILENRHSTPIEKITKLTDENSNTKIIDASVDTYKSFTGNAVKPSLLLSYKKFQFNKNSLGIITSPYDGSLDDIPQNTSYRETTSFNDYNKYGQIRSITINQLENNALVHAYKGLYPVAEIKNSLWNTTLQNIENIVLDNVNSSTIWSTIESNKPSLTNSLVNTYVFTPLIGLNKTSSPNGLVKLYSYDSFNRLFEIKEKEGEIERLLKSYKYNYKH